MKIEEYFPNLPNSHVEDMKRFKFINSMIQKNPFIFHKKKYFIRNLGNANQELLFFQRDNEKYNNLYHNFMKIKSKYIEENAKNYIKYLTSHRNENFFPENNKNTIINDNIPVKNMRNQNIFQLNKNYSQSFLFTPRNYINKKLNFIPNNIKAKGSDITNPFYYDRAPKEIFKLNQEVMNYNKKISENRYILKKKLHRNLIDELPIGPGKINNPRYYNLGESILEINPIINKGQYLMPISKSCTKFKRFNYD